MTSTTLTEPARALLDALNIHPVRGWMRWADVPEAMRDLAVMRLLHQRGLIRVGQVERHPSPALDEDTSEEWSDLTDYALYFALWGKAWRWSKAEMAIRLTIEGQGVRQDMKAGRVAVDLSEFEREEDDVKECAAIIVAKPGLSAEAVISQMKGHKEHTPRMLLPNFYKKTWKRLLRYGFKKGHNGRSCFPPQHWPRA